MAEFTIEIAGKAAHITSLFESTRHYCQNYLTEAPAEVYLTVTAEELIREQALLRQEALEEGLRPRQFQDPFLERSVLQRKLGEALLAWDILLFHGSAVAVDGKGYLFTANCGTGKSTHTRLWRQVFGDRVVMVNDDKPFLRFAREEVFLCGSPWSGKHGLDTNVTVPLKGLCILERGTENRIVSIPAREALAMLRKQSAAPESPLVERLSQAVPLWRMQCNREPQAALTAFGAMYQE